MSKQTLTFDASKLSTEVVGTVAAVSYGDTDAYVGMAEDIDEATFKKVENYRQGYINAATTTAAEHADKLLKSNKELESATYSFPYSTVSRGAIDITVTREKSFTAGFGGGEPIRKSTIRAVVTDPFNKPTQALVKGFEKTLTANLLGL